MRPLRTVFAGTPEFAVPALQVLLESEHRPLAVLTQPDRGVGRGRKIVLGPVKQLALDAGVEVLQPASLRASESSAALVEFKPDLLITAAYGLLLPPRVLEIPVHGCWNLHASLLPRWRGASPINQAILAGDEQTGISLMQMEAGLDTGPVLMQAETAIGADETAGQLHDRLSLMAASLLVKGLDQLVSGRLPAAVPQNEALATHAPLIDKSDARLDWAMPAEQLARQVRAYNPWPIAHGDIAGQPCRIFRAQSRPDLSGSPGELLRGGGHKDRITVACGQGALDVFELQAPNRKRVSARDWLNAHPDWA